MNAHLSVPRADLAAFCRAHGIKRLALFGSALREDFGPDSDIDLLVEFEPDRIPGLLGIAGMEKELSELFAGRKVDLRTAEDLSPYFRQKVLDSAEVQYARTRRRPPAPHDRRRPRGDAVGARARTDLEICRLPRPVAARPHRVGKIHERLSSRPFV